MENPENSFMLPSFLCHSKKLPYNHCMAESALSKMETQQVPEGEAMDDALPEKGEVREDVLAEAARQLKESLSHYESPGVSVMRRESDRLKERYTIHCDKMLPQFSYGGANAYAVTDSKDDAHSYFAYICNPMRPYRARALAALGSFPNNHLIRLADHGVAHISATGDARYVLVYQKPDGKRLSDLLTGSQRLPENVFIEKILKPLHEVIAIFEEKGISHCRIHPANLFMGEGIVLGDCVAESASYSKPFLYEPLERLMASQEGMGAGSTKVDVYSLAVLAIECMFGLERFSALSKEHYAALQLHSGTYNVMTSQISVSSNLSDFLIGALNDNTAERWGVEQLGNWLGGKRYNLLHPSEPRDSHRPFVFAEKEYHSLRTIAHTFHRHWDDARAVVRDDALPRWIDQCMHKKNRADVVRRAIDTSGGMTVTNQKLNDELLSKVISALDPDGPLRYMELSLNFDMLGPVLCSAIRTGNQRAINQINAMIRMDLPNFWCDQQGAHLSKECSDILWKMQRTHRFISRVSVGFGIERFLYEMNPHLPCMSERVIASYPTSLKELLLCLDALAVESHEDSLVDRNIAAYITCHANIAKETGFLMLGHYPKLAQSPELQVMFMLAKAQEKSRVGALRGLASWAGYRLIGLLSCLHSQKVRKQITRDIIAAAEYGQVSLVLGALINSKMLAQDAEGFLQAVEVYKKNNRKIARLTDVKAQAERNQYFGRRISLMVSVGMLSYAIYHVLKLHAL